MRERRRRWRRLRPARADARRTGVVGAGAIGTIVAAHLARTGPVMLFTRTADEARRLSHEGLRLGDEAPQPIDATHDAAAAADCDVLLLAVKTTAAGGLAAIGGAFAGLVVSLQNGEGNAERVRAVFGENRPVALAPTTIGGTRRAAGSVTNVTIGATTIGWATPGEAEGALPELVERFNRAGLPATYARDVRPAVWAKLVVNGAINAAAALAGVPNGAILEDPALRARVAALAREGAAVAVALGIVLPYPDPAVYVEAVAAATARNRNSMLQDLEAGRATEIAAINGAIVRAAAAAGIDAPAHRRVVNEIAAAERRRSA